jgi:hypothetical protein
MNALAAPEAGALIEISQVSGRWLTRIVIVAWRRSRLPAQ